jgi:two-component system OmpR family sensor kinase
MRRQALLRLDAVCERLARLVRSLLGASRIQAGQLTVQCHPIDVAALAARVTDDCRAYTPSHDLEFAVLPEGTTDDWAADGPGDDVGEGRARPPDGEATALGEAPLSGLPTVAYGDAERLEDVLVNLLANAAKYAPSGSAIRVHVLPHPESVELQVIDQGPGIPEEEQATVFERFRRGHGVAASGVGLGLYIAQAYVQAMGGQIGVRSALGHGATFWVRLPRKGAALSAELPRLRAESTSASRAGGRSEQGDASGEGAAGTASAECRSQSPDALPSDVGPGWHASQDGAPSA